MKSLLLAVLLLVILLTPSLVYAQQYEINPYVGTLNTGTPTALNLGDDYSVQRQLGFTFDYFGQSYNNVWVSSNGFVSFSTSNNLCCQGYQIDNPSTPLYTIFGMWTDLISGGNPFVQTTTVNGLSTFTAGWYNTFEFYNNRSQSFEISLNSDSSFSILYGNITDMQNHQVLAGYTGGAGENYQIYYGQNSGHLSGTGYRFSIPVEEEIPMFDPIFDIVDIGLDFLDVGPGGGGFQDTVTDPIIETFTEFDYSEPFIEEFQQEPFEQAFEDSFETAFEEHFEEFLGGEESFDEAFEESFEASQEISEELAEAFQESREIAEDLAEEREEELAEERAEDLAEEREEELSEEREEELAEERAEEREESSEESNEEDRLSPEELAALEAKSDQEENLNELEDKLASDEAAASEERSEKLEEELAITDAAIEEQLQQEQAQSKTELQSGQATTSRTTQAEGSGLRGDQSQLRVESVLAAAGQSSLQMLSSASGTQSLAMSQQEQMQQMIGTTESAFFGSSADSLNGMFSAFSGAGSLSEGTQLAQSTLGDLASGNISQLTQSDLLLGRMDPPAEKPAREPVESEISGDESATIETMATVPGFSQYTITRPQVQPDFYTSPSPYGRALRDNNLRMYQMSNDAVWEKLRGEQYGR